MVQVMAETRQAVSLESTTSSTVRLAEAALPTTVRCLASRRKLSSSREAYPCRRHPKSISLLSCDVQIVAALSWDDLSRRDGSPDETARPYGRLQGRGSCCRSNRREPTLAATHE